MRRQCTVGHTFYPGLIIPGSWGLDIGCRGYEFTDTLVGLGLRVVAVDPGPGATRKDTYDVRNVNAAVVGKKPVVSRSGTQVTVQLAERKGGTGQASFVYNIGLKTTKIHQLVEVPAVTVPGLMRIFNINRFSIVKIDCEGSEYGILSNWPGPIADQITVEFHDRFRRGPYPDDPERFYRETVYGHLAKWYQVAKHELTGSPNQKDYWNTLLVLRGLISPSKSFT
jgi:FkbM family methyltransferase